MHFSTKIALIFPYLKGKKKKKNNNNTFLLAYHASATLSLITVLIGTNFLKVWDTNYKISESLQAFTVSNFSS